MEQEHNMSKATVSSELNYRAHIAADFIALVRNDSRLKRLSIDTRKIGVTCRKADMSEDGVMDIWYAAIKPRIVDLVGYAALTARHDSLKTMHAYDVTYEVLLDVLHNPARLYPKTVGHLTYVRLSELADPPTASRNGDDLIIERWFSFK